jgi:hypothetical protein
MSNWGQGAVNNNIGWGQGAINNICWGDVYSTSWSGDTNIIGSPIPAIILTFQERVIADGGIYENGQSLNDILTNLNNIQ